MRRNFYRTSTLVATSFFAGSLTQKVFDGRKKETNTLNCANHLSMELLKKGWRPCKVEATKDLPSIYISHFKPALTGSTAYAFIQRGDDFFVALNKQKRRLPNGEWSFVADVPCGFYNVRQDDLEHTQRVIGTIGKQGANKTLLTHAQIQDLVANVRRQTLEEKSKKRSHQLIDEYPEETMLNLYESCEMNSGCVGIPYDVLVNVKKTSIERNPYPLIDKTPTDTALRELYEETGYEPKNKKGTLLNLESVNAGAYFYYRFVFLDHLSLEMSLPSLTPAKNEGIEKSIWVNVRDIQFKHDKLGKVISGSVCIDGEELILKPTDKTAANLAYAISYVTGNRFGSSQNPGQSYEEPGLDGIKLK